MKPKSKFDGLVHRMPAKQAPLALRKLFPVLGLPEQRTAAPTLKSRVALAIPLQRRRA